MLPEVNVNAITLYMLISEKNKKDLNIQCECKNNVNSRFENVYFQKKYALLL